MSYKHLTFVVAILCDETNRRVPIGIHAVDDLLRGGVPPGIIVDVFGGHGTGKTQMLLQAAARFSICDVRKRVLYVDTVGTFRPERVLEMAAGMKDAFNYDALHILDAISVARIQTVSDQIRLAETLLYGKCPYDLVVIDSLTDLFSYEYGRYGDLREKRQKFFRHVRDLARLATRNGVTVMASNMVRASNNGTEVENMAAEVDLFAHIKIHLISEARDFSAKKQLCGYVSCVMCDAAEPTHIAATSFDYDIATRKDADAKFSYVISESGIKTI